MMFPQTINSCAPLRRFRWIGMVALSAILLTAASPSRAATITYVAANLTDTTPGQDLWEYTYRISLANFASGEGFTVNFDRNLYALLQSPPPIVNADWDVITIQPDLALNSNGFYDALALRNSASLTDPFKVRFVWRGNGSPGSQSFSVHDRNFAVVSQGQTAAVPEPSTRLFMVGISAVILLSRRTGPWRRLSILDRQL